MRPYVLLVVLCLLSFRSVVDGQPNPLGDELVARFKADGNANDDVGPFFSDGTLENGATYGPGVHGQAFCFDGIEADVVVLNTPDTDFLPDTHVTITLWAKLNVPLTTDVHIFGKRSGCGPFPFWQRPVSASGTTPGIPASYFPVGQWVHVTYQLLGPGVENTFVDGVLITETISGGPFIGPVGDSLRLGKSGSCAAWPGCIDEVLIFHRGLTDAEVGALASQTHYDLISRGDLNHDAQLDIADPITNLDLLFGSGPPGPTLDCQDALDANDDGQMDIADPIFLLSYLFASGPSPPEPFLACGLDETPDSFSCEEACP